MILNIIGIYLKTLTFIFCQFDNVSKPISLKVTKNIKINHQELLSLNIKLHKGLQGLDSA